MTLPGAGFTMMPAASALRLESLNRTYAANTVRWMSVLGRTLHGTEIESRVQFGLPGPMLCDLAGQLGVDAVVVGSQGRSGISRLALGSVSNYVVRNAPCPVLVVRPETARSIDRQRRKPNT